MTLRNANLQTIHTTALAARQTFVDIVADKPDVRYTALGKLDIQGEETANGRRLMMVDPSPKAHRQLAARADVPFKFYDRILGGHTALWSATMNELGPTGPTLYRTLQNGPVGVLRAALSDRYEVIDNVDTLTTLLKAFTDAGLGANDLEVMGDFDDVDGRLIIRVTVPAIAVNAKDLLASYRAPWNTDRTGTRYPMVFAGLELSNSETGNGAYSIKPRIVWEVCRNGMTRDAAGEAFRKVHLGARLERGVIAWSDETRQRQLELVASAARDAITTFISPAYVRKVVDEMSAARGVAVADTTAAVARVVETCALTDDEARSVLDAFVRSADMSVLGLASAVTATAANVADGDRQAELESAFWAIVGNAEAHTGA
jgi:hypothetical protein